MNRIASLLAVILLAPGCLGSKPSRADINTAREFERFPLYWLGERFRNWDLTAIDGLDYDSRIITFIYGSCTSHDGDQPSCTPPLQVQVSASCSRPNTVLRRIRGAPVGSIDSAPVLYARGAEVKVYRGEGSAPGDPTRALRTLRSINRVPPVIGPEDRIPPCSS